MSAYFSFPVTFFSDYAAQHKDQRSCTLHDLADLARDTSAAAKAQLPWWKLATFGDRRTSKGSLRHDANLLAITGIEADYDSGEMTYEDATELLVKLGVMALLYTSPSHTEDAPRWRVMCPLSTQIPAERRQHMLGRLNGAFRGVFSRESWTLSQSYYYGSVNGNPSHQVEAFLGHTIDQLDDLDDCWIGPPGANASTGIDGIISTELREDAELIRCAVTGDGYHVEMCSLAARYVGRGVPSATVDGILRGLMLARPERVRDERWHSRYEDIPTLVSSAVAKYAGKELERRRAIARIVHRMADDERAPDDILSAIRAEAARVELPSDRAIQIADAILLERAVRADVRR